MEDAGKRVDAEAIDHSSADAVEAAVETAEDAVEAVEEAVEAEPLAEVPEVGTPAYREAAEESVARTDVGSALVDAQDPETD